ncbi:unnamed protein product, partial [Amoebophrya sp. A120]
YLFVLAAGLVGHGLFSGSSDSWKSSSVLIITGAYAARSRGSSPEVGFAPAPEGTTTEAGHEVDEGEAYSDGMVVPYRGSELVLGAKKVQQRVRKRTNKTRGMKSCSASAKKPGKVA